MKKTYKATTEQLNGLSEEEYLFIKKAIENDIDLNEISKFMRMISQKYKFTLNDMIEFGDYIAEFLTLKINLKVKKYWINS